MRAPGRFPRDWSPRARVCPTRRLREFQEEVGWLPTGELLPLGEVKLRSGKVVTAFALLTEDSESDILERFLPGAFTMEWPPRSGQSATFPEIDRIEFFSPDDARTRLNPAQAPLVGRLESRLSSAKN